MQLKVLGKPVGPGTIMSIKGHRGKFKFHSVSWSKAGKMSLTFIGPVLSYPDEDGEYPLAPHGCYRSFYPDKVKKVFG